MSDATLELQAKAIIKLGKFGLYVLLFISFVVIYGHFDDVRTIPFIGAVVALIISVLLFLKDEEPEKKDLNSSE